LLPALPNNGKKWRAPQLLASPPLPPALVAAVLGMAAFHQIYVLLLDA
jgi:hypothetical protein